MGQAVAPRLHTPVGIERGRHVGKLVEQVEGIEHQVDAAVHQALRHAGVPHQVVLVHGTVVVTAAAVHGQVGGGLEIERQFPRGPQSVLVVPGIDAVEVGPRARGVHPQDLGVGSERETAQRAAEFQVLRQIKRPRLVAPGGRVYEQRECIVNLLNDIPHH